MQSTLQPTGNSKGLIWTGRIISVLPVLALAMSASMKLAKAPAAVDGMNKFGYPPGVLMPLGIVELSCAILYAIPQTSVLGAILITGYLGGATATHVRVSDPTFWMPILLGVLAWLGLLFRDARLRPLLPVRR